MGIEVELKIDDALGYRLDVAMQNGLRAAGAEILALSNAGAPTEPDAKHGVHLRETGAVRPGAGVGGELGVWIFYGAYWAVWQHERLDYAHPHGGHAKFLELALVEGAPAALETIAASIREALA